VRGHTFKRILLVSAATGLWLTFPTQLESQPKPPETVVLKGAPMGGVKFQHSLHAQRAASKCEVCHHASKPEKPNKSPQQACSECHTKPVQTGMKTGRQAAFHDAAARTGNCINCHKKEIAAGKKAPVKCIECHKKENI
jgi:sRNA-binding protein